MRNKVSHEKYFDAFSELVRRKARLEMRIEATEDRFWAQSEMINDHIFNSIFSVSHLTINFLHFMNSFRIVVLCHSISFNLIFSSSLLVFIGFCLFAALTQSTMARLFQHFHFHRFRWHSSSCCSSENGIHFEIVQFLFRANKVNWNQVSKIESETNENLKISFSKAKQFLVSIRRQPFQSQLNVDFWRDPCACERNIRQRKRERETNREKNIEFKSRFTGKRLRMQLS